MELIWSVVSLERFANFGTTIIPDSEPVIRRQDRTQKLAKQKISKNIELSHFPDRKDQEKLSLKKDRIQKLCNTSVECVSDNTIKGTPKKNNNVSKLNRSARKAKRQIARMKARDDKNSFHNDYWHKNSTRDLKDVVINESITSSRRKFANFDYSDDSSDDYPFIDYSSDDEFSDLCFESEADFEFSGDVNCLDSYELSPSYEASDKSEDRSIDFSEEEEVVGECSESEDDFFDFEDSFDFINSCSPQARQFLKQEGW
ncbi:MAG: hypothetical protein VX777_06705 [Chlamydiota bacterium]|nr:hypothetical protein [Chlamydiota bacterium]